MESYLGMSGIYLWLAIFMAGAIAVPAIKPEEPTSTNMLKKIRRMFSKQPKAAARLCWESLERPEANHRLPALCQRLFVKQGLEICTGIYFCWCKY